MGKPHVVIDVRMFGMAGIGTYLREVLPYIIQCGEFNISVLGYEAHRQHALFSSVEYIVMYSPILGAKEQLELFRKIPSCDLFWAPNWNIPLLPVPARKMVSTIHDINHIVNPGQFGKLKQKVAGYMVKQSLKKSEAIITVSAFTQSELHKIFPQIQTPVHAIHLAVASDFDRYMPMQIPVSNYLLSVGNVKPHKNLKQALEGFEKINAPGLNYVIVGKKEGFITGYGNELEALVNRLGNKVFFTGEVDKNTLQNYYAHARAFVFPSLYEGFGLPLLEAMKFNLPILSSNRASLTEIGNNQVIYFDPGEHNDFESKLTYLLHAYPEGSRLNYSEHLSLFSWEETARRHIKLFLSCVKASS